MFTLKIRSAPAGELWGLFTGEPDVLKEVVGDIMATQGFQAGYWNIEIGPYNKKTDCQNISDMRFLGPRVQCR